MQIVLNKNSSEIIYISELVPAGYSGNLSISIASGITISLCNDSIAESITCTVGDYATLTLMHNQNSAVESFDTTYTITLGYKSVLNHTMLFTGAQTATIAVNVILEKPYAQANLYGAYALAGNQTATISTTQEHRAPNTQSNLVYKGLLAGTASASYHGLITIDQCANGSNANQQNKNLLLQSGARATSIPSLQALTNNIACRHGSAVGQLDKDQLWYLQSRGIALADAQQLLVKAFLAEALHGITDIAKQQGMQSQVVKKLFDTQGVLS
jgi:Fe-S cluster assembly protein SufD